MLHRYPQPGWHVAAVGDIVELTHGAAAGRQAVLREIRQGVPPGGPPIAVLEPLGLARGRWHVQLSACRLVRRQEVAEVSPMVLDSED